MIATARTLTKFFTYGTPNRFVKCSPIYLSMDWALYTSAVNAASTAPSTGPGSADAEYSTARRATTSPSSYISTSGTRPASMSTQLPDQMLRHPALSRVTRQAR